MYASINFQTKFELEKAVRDGLQVGLKPSLIGEQVPKFGAIDIEGPWFFKEPLWSAKVVITHGIIRKVSRWEVNKD